MSEKLDSKNVTTRKDQVCAECGRRFPSGTPMMKFQDNRPQEDYTEYKSAYICYDCQKYYKRKSPKIF